MEYLIEKGKVYKVFPTKSGGTAKFYHSPEYYTKTEIADNTVTLTRVNYLEEVQKDYLGELSIGFDGKEQMIKASDGVATIDIPLGTAKVNNIELQPKEETTLEQRVQSLESKLDQIINLLSPTTKTV